MNQTAAILELAHRQHLLRAADVCELGCSPQLLIRMHQSGRLKRVARGLYSLPDTDMTEHQTLLEVCQRVPKAVICLLSALQFHELGTQLPHEVWIALPEGTQKPAVDYPPLRIARMRGAAYSEGIEISTAHGTPIRVYSVAKTVADCFKFRNKIGLDVALEALKDAWGTRKLNMTDLAHFAKVNRVEQVMRPYLESIVS